MGNKHPLSVRLKRNIKWYKIIYKWEGINKHIDELDKINKIILQKYKGRLISKPIYENTSNKINVIIYEHKTMIMEDWVKIAKIRIYKKNRNAAILKEKRDIKTIISSIEIEEKIDLKSIEKIKIKDMIELKRALKKVSKKELKELKSILEKIKIKEIQDCKKGIRKEIKKPIKINVIKLKYLQSDTRVMGKYYQIGLKRKSLSRMRKKVKRMIKPIGISLREKYEKYNTNWYKWTDIRMKRINSRIISGIRGIYIKIKGKISKQRRVKRGKKYIIRIGTLEFNKVSNILDYDQIKTIGVNGVYNIKISINTWISLGDKA